MRPIHLFLFAVLLGACIAAPTAEPTPTAAPPYRITSDENPFEPKLEDVGWQIASVTITSVDFSERYDFTPPRAVLGLVGYMPSVCNELRVEISPPDEEYNVFIEVYSLVNPNIQCDNVFQQFETSILLGTYSPGRYYVWINDSLAGDFVSY
ncbi:MAG: hypothetical protein HYU84_14260 [Chloroflexi bacterium]|nr:hypothetical protein [Chloroflexota bacterium]MBI3167376.1 hypothetical protein [Chloroflexota bacterium]